MRGDSQYGNQHQHGIQSSARPAPGAHLMKRAESAEVKKIHQTSSSFRGHLKLTFTDGTELTLERGQYDVVNPPKVGEIWPRVAEAAFNEPQPVSGPEQVAAADSPAADAGEGSGGAVESTDDAGTGSESAT